MGSFTILGTHLLPPEQRVSLQITKKRSCLCKPRAKIKHLLIVQQETLSPGQPRSTVCQRLSLLFGLKISFTFEQFGSAQILVRIDTSSNPGSCLASSYHAVSSTLSNAKSLNFRQRCRSRLAREKTLIEKLSGV